MYPTSFQIAFLLFGYLLFLPWFFIKDHKQLVGLKALCVMAFLFITITFLTQPYGPVINSNADIFLGLSKADLDSWVRSTNPFLVVLLLVFRPAYLQERAAKKQDKQVVV